MNIAIVLPDGVGIKNYLYGDLLDKISEKNEILIWHNLDEKAVTEIKKVKNFDNIKFEKMPLFREPIFQSFIRELICLSRLIYNSKKLNNSTILTNWNPKKRGSIKTIYFTIIEFLARSFFSKSYKRILNLEKRYTNSLKRKKYTLYDHVLIQNKIDKVFCTHQRAIAAIPTIESAKKLGIETISAIYSWDNLPKARLNVKANKYLVWSNYMKEEMLLLYPEIQEKNITITGSPQFEFYNKETLFLEKEDFYKTYDLDVNKKIICFSGDDRYTSPNDQYYLNDIAGVIDNLSEEIRPQILFRRSPGDFSDRYDFVFENYPGLIKIADPIWLRDANSTWSSNIPTFKDVILLNSIVKYCDAVINLGSTMVLDFSRFNKPGIYINYDIDNNINWSVKTVYNFHHFKSMGDLNPLYWLNSKEEILEVINKALHDSESNKKIMSGINSWFDMLINHPENSSSFIKDVLEK